MLDRHAVLVDHPHGDDRAVDLATVDPTLGERRAGAVGQARRADVGVLGAEVEPIDDGGFDFPKSGLEAVGKEVLIRNS